MARLLAGPATSVFYEMSTLQLDTGISLVPSTQSVSVEPRKVAVGSLTFRADPNAPLGENTLFVDQIAFNKRRGNLLPVIVGDHPSASVDDSIRWSLASEQGIQIDDGGTVWHSGRLRDVLVTASREILVAAETGGVWAVTREGQSVSLADWDRPDVNCLAQGPDGPQHVYAAGQSLFETDVLSGIPLLSWKEISLIDATGTAIVDVRRMVVLPQSRRLVLVASGGVYWANISAGSVASRTYSFQKVPALPDGGRGYLGAAVGPNEGIAVTMWGTDARRATIFFGRWEGGQPVLREAALGTGVGQLAMYATTLTSCQSDPSRMYAVSSDVDGYPSVALRSDDGGASWNMLPLRLGGSFEKFRNAAGNQGNEDPPNINIAVSPRQKDRC